LRKTPEYNIVSKCIDEAKSAGGDDNISVILVKVTN
jgi:serine/threonine protein phosphatase PrpC